MQSVDSSLYFASGICFSPCVSDVKEVFSRHQSSAVNLTMSWSFRPDLSHTCNGHFQHRAWSTCSTKFACGIRMTHNTGQRRTRASNHQEISAAASHTIRERTEKKRRGGTLFHPPCYLWRWVYPSFQAWPISEWKFTVCSVYIQRRQVNRTTLIDLFKGERMK